MHRFRNVMVTFMVLLGMIVLVARPARGLAAPRAGSTRERPATRDGRIVGYFIEWAFTPATTVSKTS